MRTRLTPVLILGLSACAQSVQAAEYLHPRLQSGEKTIRAVVALPSKAAVHTLYAWIGRTDALPEEFDALAEKLSSTVIATLRARGWQVQQDLLGAAALERKPLLKFSVDVLQAEFDRLAVELGSDAKGVRKGRYSLAGDLRKLGLEGQVDALVFIRGSHLKGAVRGKYTAVTLVDVSDGGVLFHFGANSVDVGPELLRSLQKVPR